MNWNDLLAILLQVLAAELPDAVAYLIDWLKAWLDSRLGTMAALADVPTGTLEEFKAAVRQRIAAIGAGLPLGVRLIFNRVMSRLSDQILDRVYRIVVGQEQTPIRAMSCPDTVRAVLDELAAEDAA